MRHHPKVLEQFWFDEHHVTHACEVVDHGARSGVTTVAALAVFRTRPPGRRQSRACAPRHRARRERREDEAWRWDRWGERKTATARLVGYSMALWENCAPRDVRPGERANFAAGGEVCARRAPLQRSGRPRTVADGDERGEGERAKHDFGVE